MWTFCFEKERRKAVHTPQQENIAVVKLFAVPVNLLCWDWDVNLWCCTSLDLPTTISFSQQCRFYVWSLLSLLGIASSSCLVDRTYLLERAEGHKAKLAEESWAQQQVPPEHSNAPYARPASENGIAKLGDFHLFVHLLGDLLQEHEYVWVSRFTAYGLWSLIEWSLHLLGDLADSNKPKSVLSSKKRGPLNILCDFVGVRLRGWFHWCEIAGIRINCS